MNVKREEGIKRTGELLLSGWKMLALICPICSSPLMEKGKECCCPSCNLPIARYNELSPYTSPPSSLPSLPSPSNSSITHSTSSPSNNSNNSKNENESKFHSLEEAKKEYDKKQSKQRLVSSKIGEYLLNGWTLLAKECNVCGTPLMNLRGGPFYCVLCDKTFSNEIKKDIVKENKEIIENQIEQKKNNELFELNKSAELLANIPILEDDFMINNDDNDNEDYEDPSGIIEEASQLIGGKLLLGWTLLDEACEGACQGNVPLMKDPVKKQVMYIFFFFSLLISLLIF